MKTKLLPLWIACALFVAAVPASFVITGCKTVGPDGVPVYDPVRSKAVVAALTPVVQDPINRVLRNSPQHSDEIASYIRSVGNVFCAMKVTGQFSPDTLIREIEKATAPLQANVDPLIITVKNAAIALYTVFYLQSQTAELPPDKWPAHVAMLFCNAIDGGLKDAGKAGVK